MKIEKRYEVRGGGDYDTLAATTMEDAIEEGREWIEGGDWESESSLPEEGVFAVQETRILECEVQEILILPREDGADDQEVLGQYVLTRREDGTMEAWIDPEEIESVVSEVDPWLGEIQVTEERDQDGWVLCIISPGVSWETEEVDGETADCSGTYADEDPECPVEEGWDFVGISDAGFSDFDAYGHGGTAMSHYDVCRNTGMYRDTYDPGFQRNPGEPVETVNYRYADEKSRAYVIKYHEEDGVIPEWLAEYFEIPTEVEDED